jgi:hypothetical protein
VDAFKLTILATVMISLIMLGFIVFVAHDAISNSTIPDVERGVVVSKAVVTDKPIAKYAVFLSDGIELYIRNDEELFNSIIENYTYVFDCKIDFNNHMLMMESVNPQSGTVTSKAQITDNSQAKYAVYLASGKILYIANNATLYNEILVNQRYLFDCRIIYANNLVMINKVQFVTDGTQ